jgi:hypothetical protein
MVSRSFYGALDVKIMDRLVRAIRMVGRSFYGALDVKIMDRLARATRIQWWADPSTEHWMSR